MKYRIVHDSSLIISLVRDYIADISTRLNYYCNYFS